ncbi:hypothetical protein EX30DRAFT_333262 [Ascodesmis nigricans]|uniref:GID complex catalytic subunit 2 n=1 Tax=Ascodesmis nigricans TaxID=341454 RepID=A0A4S2MT77_9PEZI|nr:hypothetical protein EX30DRAFT_333262 [Ascodesmis nigricans]
MDAIEAELTRLTSKSNLSKALTNIDGCLELLQAARNQIAEDPDSAAKTLAMLQQTMNSQLEKVGSDHKDVYTGLNKFGKALDKKFKSASAYHSPRHDNIANKQPELHRAVAMHLMREGHFSVASHLLDEATGAGHPIAVPPSLEEDFRTLYSILDSLSGHDLNPAIEWAHSRAHDLEHRGSNLEFELCRLKFITLFLDALETGPEEAMQFARTEFHRFQQRHFRDCLQLFLAFTYRAGIAGMMTGKNQPKDVVNPAPYPYYNLFQNVEERWENIGKMFTSEYCGLLGLSAESPLFLAVTAGSVALPVLEKLRRITEDKGTEWTSHGELPVEIPLPSPRYHFHSIFVCPVSKGQTTEDNPPMILPCGHVIAKESLDQLAKGNSANAHLKCPYCPKECTLGSAMQVII